MFWLLTFLALAGLLWLLSEVLLPFVAGFALAYLQVPLADRLERMGMNRTLAALLIVTVVMVALIAVLLLVRAAAGAAARRNSWRACPTTSPTSRQIATDWLNWLQVAAKPRMTLSEVLKQALGLADRTLPTRCGPAARRWCRSPRS